MKNCCLGYNRTWKIILDQLEKKIESEKREENSDWIEQCPTADMFSVEPDLQFFHNGISLASDRFKIVLLAEFSNYISQLMVLVANDVLYHPPSLFLDQLPEVIPNCFEIPLVVLRQLCFHRLLLNTFWTSGV